MQAYIPTIAWWLFRILSKTLHVRTIGQSRIDRLKSSGDTFVYSVWHGQHYCFYHHIPHTSGKGILVSPSKDGKLVAAVLIKSGYRIIHGSSHKSPVRGLLALVREAKKGLDIVVTVDGPRGPVHQVKPGALFVAQKSGASILPIVFAARKKFTFRSWDRYFIPLPFTKAVIMYGKPYAVAKDANIDDACIELGKILENLSRLAARNLG